MRRRGLVNSKKGEVGTGRKAYRIQAVSDGDSKEGRRRAAAQRGASDPARRGGRAARQTTRVRWSASRARRPG